MSFGNHFGEHILNISPSAKTAPLIYTVKVFGPALLECIVQVLEYLLEGFFLVDDDDSI